MELRVFFFLILACSSSLFTHQYEYFKAKESTMPSAEKIHEKQEVLSKEKDSEILIPKLRAIIITSGDESVPTHIRNTTQSGVTIYRAMPTVSFDSRESFRKELWKSVGNKPLTKAQLIYIKRQIAQFYKSHGQVHVIVRIPEQEITDGILTVQVTEARVGNVVVTGDKWFKKDLYRNYLRVDENDVLNNDILLEDLRLINNNPFRKATLIYKPGKQTNTTDVELAIQDEKPIQFYIGADNTGFKSTDYERLFVGINWGNAFNLDQILAFQYTASPDFHKYQSFNAYYTAALPNRDYLTAFGGYSAIHASHAELPANVSKGQSYQLSGRYVFSLHPASTWMQEAKVGLDWKRTNNDFEINETLISSSLASVFQIVGTYDASWSNKEHSFKALAEGFLQPWNIGDSMSDSTYNQLRPDASNHYFYTRLSGKYTYTFPVSEVVLQTKLQMQLSTNALIPTELFGLGGYNSVRGYVEREINVDDAILFNFEALSPSISPSKHLRSSIKMNDRIQALGFLDMGGGWLIKTSGQDQPDGYFLASIGPGVRYRIIPYLELRMDYGFRLTDVPFAATYTSIGRFNFSVMASY